jgi:poly(hydroxyalkanoate) granule-associated protein
MPTPQFPFSFDFLNPAKMPEGTQQSAQEIWLAGLGAFAKAQKEGENAFQKLVQDGVSMQKKNQEEAQRKLAEATEKMSALAGDMAAKAGGNWGKLEGIFEDRVARALKQLGVPTADDVAALRDEVAALRAQVKALGGKTAPAPAKKPAAKKAAARKSAR